MRAAFSVADVRAAEAVVMGRTPPGALMARAARGLAVACVRWLESRGLRVSGARVVVLAGSGNNGGDALFAAAHLASRGAAVAVVALGGAIHEAGAAAVARHGGRVMSADHPGAEAAVAAADLVLDGIVGIGGSGPLREGAARVAAAGRGRIVAVDLPSGIDPDTGEVADPDACVEAELTVTFGVIKPGLVLPDGCWQAGLVELVDIGLAPALSHATPVVESMTAPAAGALVPTPGRADDKYTRGVVGVVAGSAPYPGAGILCTGSSRLGGVGMVRYAGGVGDIVVSRWPEIVLAHAGPADAGRVQAWIVGPGAGTDADARDRLAQALAIDVPVLIDADAITCVADDTDLRRTVQQRSAPTLFTPHAGEFARLGGDLTALGGRLAAVRRLAAELSAVVLLKGAATVVAAADGTAAVSASGPPDLATAGSGDVLSGLVGSMLASGAARAAARGADFGDADVVRVAAAGAYLHGLAGRLAASGGRPVVSEDVLRAVPDAIAIARDATADEWANSFAQDR